LASWFFHARGAAAGRLKTNGGASPGPAEKPMRCRGLPPALRPFGAGTASVPPAAAAFKAKKDLNDRFLTG